MKPSIASLVLLGLLAGVLSVHDAVGQDKSNPRPFIGSFDVSEKTRDLLLKRLKEKGFPGIDRVYIPGGAGPDVLMYKGTKAEYDEALKIWWDLQAELERPEQQKKQPQVRPAPKIDDLTDAEAFTRLALNEKQQKEVKEHLQWRDEATQRMHESDNPQEEGLKLNQEWNDRLKRTLTKEQYAQYVAFWEPPTRKRSNARPNMGKKTDDAIFAQLGLTEKQKAELAKLRKEVDEATEQMHALESGHQDAGLKINKTWRAGLDRILTKAQRAKYLEYWKDPQLEQTK